MSVSPRIAAITVVLMVTMVSACTFDTRFESPLADASVDVAVPPPPHLLLSEVKTSNDVANREFIEVFNPSAEPVSLANYYLADTDIYPRLPAIASGLSTTLEPSDFVARFPADSTLEPNAVVVVAIRTTDSSDFPEADLALLSGDGTASMLEAFPNSIGATANLANDDGEGIALFYWDQTSDIVADVDLLIAGFVVMPGNDLADKTGLLVDGPDDGDEPSPYADDASTIELPIRSNGLNESFVRLTAEHLETSSGGNGITGHDETSEQTRTSWGFARSEPGLPPPIEAPL